MFYANNRASLIRRLATSVLSERTARLLAIDILRLRNRVVGFGRKNVVPKSPRLHLGCGKRNVEGWLNCDLSGSEFNVDLAGGRLPWKDCSFEHAVSQHMVEHLELEGELLPLLSELHRIMKPGGAVWISCPDLEKICRSYVENGMADLIADRARMWGQFSMGRVPDQHFINLFFHERGTHKNLFDYGILKWALESVGFENIRRSDESSFLLAFPEFSRRNDDMESIYVSANRPV